MKSYMKKQGGFTLLELMVVMTIIAILMSITIPVGGGLISQARRTKDAVNQRSIVMSMINFAKDNDGNFPSMDDSQGTGEGADFTDSTAAFQYLMKNSDSLKEEYFYVPGNPEKRNGANNDGELLDEENCMIYVNGQNDSMDMDSPLTADEMESAGTYGKGHPWLKDGFAVVGYVGGHAKAEKLNKKTEGATVKGPTGSGIDDIFQERGEPDENGKISGGGKLSVSTDNILLPGGGS